MRNGRQRFLRSQFCLAKGQPLTSSPFLGQRKLLTATEMEETRCIAELHILVLRAIGKVKNY